MHTFVVGLSQKLQKKLLRCSIESLKESDLEIIDLETYLNINVYHSKLLIKINREEEALEILENCFFKFRACLRLIIP